MKTTSEEPALVGHVQVTLVDDSAEPQEETNASRREVGITRRRGQTAALALLLWMLCNPVRVVLRAGGGQSLGSGVNTASTFDPSC